MSAAADRLGPARLATTVGEMGVLFLRTIRATVRTPRAFLPELTHQLAFVLRIGWLPMLLAAFAISYGPAGIQVAGFLNLFGAIDRMGGLFAIAVVREFAPLVCAIVVAGVAGTAICADLGARKVREELDALSVLAVDPVIHLVVPRFLALVLVTMVLNAYAIVSGVAAGVLVAVVNGSTPGVFLHAFFVNAAPLEIAAATVKTAIFGGIIAIVCCHQGLNAAGGPAGVGRAVNRAVVLSFLAIGLVDYVFGAALLAFAPELSAVR
ncbi:ABC transporter permease [Patulibacter sp. NPDC049589]|uniref:MlaE family ABC transporter permease n=1 Tax=Patulibacter sp. NPDC049589 TaxID=3154731 RepID=UPI003437D41B